ncbi:MAG: glycosyltransferase family 2 protein [Rickettsiales bacterium]|nr:glycosyltransferase family 2 protein [Rickettsiales bacterium]
MDNKFPLSVFIICKNEADRIHLPIESTKDWVDEVIVVDSGSTDGTMDKAKELGATQVLFNEWPGYGPQKVFCENLCKNRWLLNLDADEACSPDLIEHIKTLFANGEPKDALYAIRNTMVFPFEDKPRKFSPSGFFVRLYPKDKAGFKESIVHDSVIDKTDSLSTLRIEAPIHHSGFRNYAHMNEKMNFYSGQQAKDNVARGKKVSALRLVLEPFVMFPKAYFGRGYWRFGSEGFVHSLFYAFWRTMRLAKTRELYKQQN